MRTKKIKALNKAIKKYPNSKNFIIPRDKLEKIYLQDKTIISLVKNNMYHHQMLMALQEQLLCLEAKIKLLEAKLR